MEFLRISISLKIFRIKIVPLLSLFPVDSFHNIKGYRDFAIMCLSEHHRLIPKFFEFICQQYSKFKTKQNDQLKAEILNYVNGHYGDCGMGLDLLSEQF